MSSLLPSEFINFAPSAETNILPVLATCASTTSAEGRRPAAETRHDGAPINQSATIRVLHLVNGEHYSGAERVQDLLARQLPPFGCEVGFACVKPRRFPAARESQMATLVEMPMCGRFDLRVVKRLAALVSDDGYDLIHAHTPRTALVGSLAARRAGVPLIYHVHSPVSRDSTRRLLNWLNAMVERFAVRDAVRLIAVSPNLREYMIGRGVPPGRIVCVPNGVPAASQFRERRPPAGTWTLGTVALFRPRKGIEVLLEALAALRSRNVDVRLRAVGGFETPAYEAAILALAERLGVAEAIDWIGFTRSVGRELAKIDLFVLPSLFGEGLPMVVLEAMASGLPVIASRVEGVPEAVVHRQTGLLVEPASVSQLHRAVDDILCRKLDYCALSQAAHQRHAEFFSDTKMAAGVAAVYREALAAHEAPAANGRPRAV
jgi:glycosyltransferase involved in cell wall biosynthesis